ncbi:MAG TPA: hypothetical protein PKH72_13015 [Rhodoferax sp.]|nr:hypothetical protein [Rhodoferax sp.]HNV60567.1 hypothetical protein [Rhodoferax sp.]
MATPNYGYEKRQKELAKKKKKEEKLKEKNERKANGLTEPETSQDADSSAEAGPSADPVQE